MYVFLQVIGGLLFIIGLSISLPLFSWVGGILFAVAWLIHTTKEDAKEKKREYKASIQEIKNYEKEMEELQKYDELDKEMNRKINAEERAKKAKRAKKSRLVNTKKANEETRKAKLKKLKSKNTRKRQA